MAAPARLTLRVLGEIEVARGSTPLALPASKKTRALLAYLAVTGRPHRRERLCELLWDVPDDPRGALRWSLSKLRALVDEPGQPRIRAERDSVAFDAAGLELDLFEARALAGPAPAEAPTADLEAAAARFRGGFLEGLDLPSCPEFRSWRAAERESARKLHAAVLSALIDRHAAAPERAIAHARALVALDPHEPEAQARLLGLLWAAGSRDEAEAQFAAAERLVGEISETARDRLARRWADLKRAAAATEPQAPPAPAPRRSAVAEMITAAERAEAPATERPTVAVLPFAAHGGAADDYFARGISDEIAAELSRSADLTVIAPSTTVRVSGDPAPAPEIARRLRANYLLDGTVQRAEQRVRLTAHLVEGFAGTHVWAERFDRHVGDIFAVQDEITRTVAAKLSVRLREAGQRRALRKRTRDLSSYDLHLRARNYMRVLTPEEHAKARDWLEEAVRRDPDFADAHAALAYVYASEYSHGHNPRPDPLGRAMAAGRRAVDLDPLNPRAHAMLAITHYFRRDDAIFEAEAERALALNPNDPEMAGTLGAYFVYAGQYERGLALLSESMRLNPLHPTWYHYSFVIWHVLGDEYAAALARLERVDIKEFHWTLLLKAAVLALSGALGEAAAAYRRFRALYPAFDVEAYLRLWIRSEAYIARIVSGIDSAARAAAGTDAPPHAAPNP